MAYPSILRRSGRRVLAAAKIKRGLLDFGQREENVLIRHDDGKNGNNTRVQRF